MSDTRYQTRMHEVLGFGLELPENLSSYLSEGYTNIHVSVCDTDCLNGYGRRLSGYISVRKYAEWCTRKHCNYHSLFKPVDDESRCGRHNLDKGYIEVFFWEYDTNKGLSANDLEQSFQRFLDRSDPEPLDIVATLKANGVEGEG